MEEICHYFFTVPSSSLTHTHTCVHGMLKTTSSRWARDPRTGLATPSRCAGWLSLARTEEGERYIATDLGSHVVVFFLATVPNTTRISLRGDRETLQVAAYQREEWPNILKKEKTRKEKEQQPEPEPKGERAAKRQPQEPNQTTRLAAQPTH